MTSIRDTLSCEAGFFGALSAAQRATLLELGTKRTYAARQLVVREGDPGDSAFIVLRGSLKVYASSPTGAISALGIMGPGEIFGELALLDGGTRSASVAAITRVELLTLARPAVLDLLASDPGLGAEILRIFAERLRRLTRRAEDRGCLPIAARLARQILILAERYGCRTGKNRLRVGMKLSQQELGELIDASRESVNKHLRRWRDQAMIEDEHGYLVVTDMEQLRRVAEDPADTPPP